MKGKTRPSCFSWYGTIFLVLFVRSLAQAGEAAEEGLHSTNQYFSIEATLLSASPAPCGTEIVLSVLFENRNQKPLKYMLDDHNLPRMSVLIDTEQGTPVVPEGITHSRRVQTEEQVRVLKPQQSLLAVLNLREMLGSRLLPGKYSIHIDSENTLQRFGEAVGRVMSNRVLVEVEELRRPTVLAGSPIAKSKRLAVVADEGGRLFFGWSLGRTWRRRPLHDGEFGVITQLPELPHETPLAFAFRHAEDGIGLKGYVVSHAGRSRAAIAIGERGPSPLLQKARQAKPNARLVYCAEHYATRLLPLEAIDRRPNRTTF